jgi:hypothetical protein
VGPRAGLDRCGKSHPPPPGFDPRTVQPVAIRNARVGQLKNFPLRINSKTQVKNVTTTPGFGFHGSVHHVDCSK